MTKSVASDIRGVQKSLSALERALRRLAVSVRTVGANSAARPSRRKLNLTPARRAALKLQGQYMGYLRNLKPKQKAQVKAYRVSKGIRAAIGMARRVGRV